MKTTTTFLAAALAFSAILLAPAAGAQTCIPAGTVFAAAGTAVQGSVTVCDTPSVCASAASGAEGAATCSDETRCVAADDADTTSASVCSDNVSGACIVSEDGNRYYVLSGSACDGATGCFVFLKHAAKVEC